MDSFRFFLFAADHIFKTCKKSEGDINKCFKDQIVNNLPVLGKGVPEIRVPQIDPLILSELSVDHHISDTVWLKADIKNLKIDGFPNLVIDDFT